MRILFRKSSTSQSSTNSVMVFATVFFLLILTASASVIEDFLNANCSSYDPAQRLRDAGDGGNCLSALRDPQYHQEFEKCKQNVCFLFIREPPFVTFIKDTDQDLKQMQLPFLCRKPTQKHRSLAGIAFNIIRETSAGDEYCVWVGPVQSCTWNALVDFVAVMGKEEGYQFAVVGPMLETPQRKCSHFASSSWWDGKMVVLGRNNRENMGTIDPVWQLISPFQRNTWIVVGSVIALFVIVCLMIVYRFHVFRGKSAITAYFVFMGKGPEVLDYGRTENNLIDGEGSFSRPSERNTPGSNELETEVSSRSTFSDAGSDVTSLQLGVNHGKVDHENVQDKAFLTKFSLATALFRISLIAFIAMFSLFYEVAVVNFLFQQQKLQITKDIEHLTLPELGRYAVVQDTAMEAVWNFRVNPRGTKFDDSYKSQIPWKRCQDGAQCFNWILEENNPVQFYVTYELEGTHLIHTQANCDLITMFETKRSIHHFNSGWLFNAQVQLEKRRQLDQELGALKISGRLSDLVGGRSESCFPNLSSSITLLIILLPVASLVLPPLLCSAVVTMWWRGTNAKKKNESIVLPE